MNPWTSSEGSCPTRLSSAAAAGRCATERQVFRSAPDAFLRREWVLEIGPPPARLRWLRTYIDCHLQSLAIPQPSPAVARILATPATFLAAAPNPPKC